MRKYVFCLLAFVPLFALAGSAASVVLAAPAEGPNCTVVVNIDTVTARMVYMAWQVGDDYKVDSALVSHGKAVLHANVNYPVFCRLWLDNRGFGYANGHKPDLLIFYLAKGNINIRTKDSVKNAVISGSPANKEYDAYKNFISGPMTRLEDLNAEMMLAPAEMRNNDSVFKNRIWDSMGLEVKVLKGLQKDFIVANPDNFASLEALMGIGGSNINADMVEPLYKGLSARVRESVPGKHMADLIAIARKTGIGVVAPDFTQNDPDGHPLKLSDFRGKYVLLDFWASWCGPCRAENPNYVKAYAAYKDKGFTLLGVSLDREGEKDAWVAAIKKDGLEWPQVSDLKYWFNAVAKMYDVRSVPTNYLIGPDGKILAKNLRGEALIKKLGEVLK